MRFIRISSMIVGLSMIGQWCLFLLTGNVPELQTSPVSIIFHISIELITAVLLIMVFFLNMTGGGRFGYFTVYVQGMLGYTVINSSGYFAQSGEYFFLIMFAVLLAVSVVNTVLVIQSLD